MSKQRVSDAELGTEGFINPQLRFEGEGKLLETIERLALDLRDARAEIARLKAELADGLREGTSLRTTIPVEIRMKP